MVVAGFTFSAKKVYRAIFCHENDGASHPKKGRDTAKTVRDN